MGDASPVTVHMEWFDAIEAVFQNVNRTPVTTRLSTDYGLLITNPQKFDGVPSDSNYVAYVDWKVKNPLYAKNPSLHFLQIISLRSAKNAIDFCCYSFTFTPQTILTVVTRFSRILALGVMAALVSCSPIYFPSPDTTPMFTKKGQTQISAGVSMGIFGQGAHAISNHLAVGTNCMILRERYAKGRTDYQMFEASTGYYRNFGNKCFEFWGGFGLGKSNTQDSLYNCFILCEGGPYRGSGKFKNIFIQSTFGKNHGKFHWSVSSKLNYLHFNELSVILEDTPIAIGRQSHVAFESTFMMRVFLWNDKVFWTFQAGFSAPLTTPKFDWLPIKASTGLGIRIVGN